MVDLGLCPPATAFALFTMEGEVEFTVSGVDKLCKTWYKVFGDLKSSSRPLVALHGGPGVVHNYLLALSDLATTHSIPVVLYDQLGNGRSTHLPDKMGDEAFWTEELFITQLKALLSHLDIEDDFDLLGHSWGGMVSARFATSHPPGLKHLVLASSPASMQLWVEAANRLRSKLPEDVQVVSIPPSGQSPKLTTFFCRLFSPSMSPTGRLTRRSTTMRWTCSTNVTCVVLTPGRRTS